MHLNEEQSIKNDIKYHLHLNCDMPKGADRGHCSGEGGGGEEDLEKMRLICITL